MAQTHPFYSPATHGFVRVAAATPVVHPADPKANADEHIRLIEQAAEQGVDLIVFPELSLSGYALDDLLMQDALLNEVERQIERVANATEGAAYGAALLGGVGAGVFTTVEEAGGRTIAVTGETDPGETVPVYRDFYPRYRALYPALQDEFKAVSEVVNRHLGS